MEKRYFNIFKYLLVFLQKIIICKIIKESSKSFFFYWQKNKTIVGATAITIFFSRQAEKSLRFLRIRLQKLTFSKITIVFLFLISLHIVDCKSEIAEKCKQVCQFSYSCIEKNQTNTLLTHKDREGFEIQCFNTCTMLQDEFLICHKKNSQSCEKYYSCLIDSDIFQ